ncbi:ABC transporter permease [Nocardioides gilvus]|uniref:ABC transporter permease n=1 Tax=Nocardioides gilvus TaxID=1735589 RepID=UPI00194F2A1B|nr:hypothetical protein [Nocardioides gilvus]
MITGLAHRLTGTRALLKVSLHQDARNIAPWVVLISALSASSILAYVWVFPHPGERAQLSMAIGANPALSLVFGPPRDLMTADGFNAWRAGQLGAFFAGLMAILIVVRNSRAEEDSGRAELIASGVIARESRLAVAVAMAMSASLALGVVCFGLTVICGGGMSATLVLAGTFAASGLVFAGVGAIAAQLGADSRAASTLAIAVLGVGYVVRGYVGSSGAPAWADWLTPFGWFDRTRPAGDNNAWPLLLAVVVAVLLVAVGFWLQARRDFGQGMLAQRPGPSGAGVARTVWGLAWKLHAGTLVSWLIAFAALGLLLGNLADSAADLVEANPVVAAILAAGATPSDLSFVFLATILQVIAIVAAAMGVQVILRVHAEEVNDRVEPLLAGSLSRSAYLASNVVVALVGTALALLVAGLCLGLVAHAQDDTIAAGDVIAQAVVMTPAVWLLVGVAVAAVGAAPSARLVAWLAVVATFGITLLGPTFRLPDWALDISPLRHAPIVVLADPEWVGLAVVGAIATLLLAVGFVGFRRRDVD